MQIIAQNTATMSSLEIAELVGSRHDSVKLTINRLASEHSDALGNVTRKAVIQLPPMVEVKNHLGQTVQVYSVCKRDSFVVVAQLCPEFTARLVDRWQELESANYGKTVALPHDYISALEQLLESKKLEQAAIEQRDHAIATKAQIGSKREASAMARASSAVREVNRLKSELGRNQKHATVIAVERATGTRMARDAYVALRRWCRENGAVSVDVADARYGTVKAWPADAWLAAYGIDLCDLFQSCEVAQ